MVNFFQILSGVFVICASTSVSFSSNYGNNIRTENIKMSQEEEDYIKYWYQNFNQYQMMQLGSPSGLYTVQQV